jgi:hypothetical protein
MPTPVVYGTCEMVHKIKTITERSPAMQSMAHICHNRINHTIPTPTIAERRPAERMEDDGIDITDTIIRFIASGNNA